MTAHLCKRRSCLVYEVIISEMSMYSVHQLDSLLVDQQFEVKKRTTPIQIGN